MLAPRSKKERASAAWRTPASLSGRSLHHLAALGGAVLGVGRLGEALTLAGVLAGAVHAGCKGCGREARGGEDGDGGRDQRTLVHGDPPGLGGRQARIEVIRR